MTFKAQLTLVAVVGLALGTVAWKVTLESRVRALFRGDPEPVGRSDDVLYSGQLELEFPQPGSEDASEVRAEFGRGPEPALALIDERRSDASFQSVQERQALDSLRAQVLCALDRTTEASASMTGLPAGRALETARLYCSRAQAFREAVKACQAGQPDRAAELFARAQSVQRTGAQVCRGLANRAHGVWVR